MEEKRRKEEAKKKWQIYAHWIGVGIIEAASSSQAPVSSQAVLFSEAVIIVTGWNDAIQTSLAIEDMCRREWEQ